ncbi:MAG: hypothetical protein OEY81_05895 [Candidatus Bathyarchaeota archaeon]|nr:hypothetical protein [Candidatus Bathyarchaeota archaeon]
MKGEIGRKFLYVKEKLGLETDEDVLIHLISEAYQKCLNPRKEKS